MVPLGRILQAAISGTIPMPTHYHPDKESSWMAKGQGVSKRRWQNTVKISGNSNNRPESVYNC